MTPLPLEHLIQERKEKAIVSLSDSYAKAKLPLEEYERLAEYISKTESERELIGVEKIVAEYETAQKLFLAPILLRQTVMFSTVFNGFPTFFLKIN